MKHTTSQASPKEPFGLRLKKDMRRNYQAYLLFLPVLAFYLIFAYKPMYGILIAFKDYSPMKGILGSPWAADNGLAHFISFFHSYYFVRLLKNTLVISITNLLVTFPAPIVLALLLNEVRSKKFKKAVQTLTYLPHFVSMVVICSMVQLFVSNTGFITQVLSSLGLVEAAQIDGANHLQILLQVMLPLVKATLAVMVLYYGVAHWNSWFNASIYLRTNTKYPLQLVLRNILMESQTTDMMSDIGAAESPQVLMLLKYALIVVSSVPIICIYPFLQKFFQKGVTLGAVKG